MKEKEKRPNSLPKLTDVDAWQNFIDSFPSGLFILDLEFHILLANQAVADLLGQDKKALRGERCYRVVHNTPEPPPFCPYKKFLSSKRLERQTFYEKHLDRHLQALVTPFYDSQELIGAIHVINDLTDVIKASEKIDDLSRKCQFIANQFDALFFVSSEDHQITFANQAVRDYFGKEVVGKKCYEVFYGFEKPCSWCRRADLDEGEILRRVFQNPKDHRWYYVTERAFREGTTISKLSLAVDITTLKEREQELRRRELFLRLLNKITFDFVREKHWLVLKRGFSRLLPLLGAKRIYLFERLTSEDVYLLRVGVPEERCPTGYLLSVSALKRIPCQQQGAVASGAIEDLVADEVFFKDQETFAQWYSLSLEGCWGFLGADFSEEPPSFVKEALKALAENLGNILARHHVEDLLRRERKRLLAVLKSMADGVIVTDRQGRIILMNRAAEEITGWAQAFAFGKPLEEVLRLRFYPTKQPENVLDVVFNFKKVYRPSRDFVLDSRDGVRRRVHLVAAPIRNADEDIEGAVVVFRDMTRYRSFEKETHQRQKLQALEVMAAGIAHDFNNLLMVIGGHVSIARFTKDPEKRERSLARAEQALEKAQQLTQRLMSFVKRGVPSKTLTDLRELIRETAEFILSGTNIEFFLELAPDLWKVKVDEVQLAQVIQNLVLNAREAMPEGGSVIVRATNVRISEDDHLPLAPGPYVRLVMQDTGCGIPSHLLPHIFDPYLTTKKNGTGLGLSVVYAVISDHDGYIEVQSKEGEGTAFTIYLPAEELAAEEKGELSSEWVERDLTPARLLILDDEEDVRQVLKEMLGFLGYEVETAATAEEAIAKYHQAFKEGKRFDMVLLDFTLPGTNGAQVLASLRELDPEVKAILTSGYADPLLIKDVDSLGAKAFLKKPFRLEELVHALNKICSEH